MTLRVRNAQDVVLLDGSAPFRGLVEAARVTRVIRAAEEANHAATGGGPP